MAVSSNYGSHPQLGWLASTALTHSRVHDLLPAHCTAASTWETHAFSFARVGVVVCHRLKLLHLEMYYGRFSTTASVLSGWTRLACDLPSALVPSFASRFRLGIVFPSDALLGLRGRLPRHRFSSRLVSRPFGFRIRLLLIVNRSPAWTVTWMIKWVCVPRGVSNLAFEDTPRSSHFVQKCVKQNNTTHLTVWVVLVGWVGNERVNCCTKHYSSKV